MKRNWTRFIGAATLGIMILIIQAASALGQPKPFKIGFIGGLTGPLAFQAVPALAGTKYMIEEVNKAGGFQGRQIELIVRDGKERPDASLNEARNLVLAEGRRA